jgi:hypothetical protein
LWNQLIWHHMDMWHGILILNKLPQIATTKPLHCLLYNWIYTNVPIYVGIPLPFWHKLIFFILLNIWKNIYYLCQNLNKIKTSIVKILKIIQKHVAKMVKILYIYMEWKKNKLWVYLPPPTPPPLTYRTNNRYH